MDKAVRPFIKWVGGKRQLLSAIDGHRPEKFVRYFEPFVGGGAVLFHVQPPKVVINDFNPELVNLYRVVKDSPLKLIEALKKHRNDKGYYYEIRALDRNPKAYSALSDIERASRILFLNRTCFNGLFRVNSAGEYNVPFGKYVNPDFVREDTITAVSAYLNRIDIEILCGDYSKALEKVKPGDFAYVDPPYDPLSDSSSFTGYTKGALPGKTRRNSKAGVTGSMTVVRDSCFQTQQPISLKSSIATTPSPLLRREGQSMQRAPVAVW